MKESFRRYGRFGKDREIEEKHEIDVENIQNFYPSQIDILMKNTFDKKLNDLVNNLIKFRREEQQMIMNNTTMPLYNFKRTLFKQIELILSQIAEIDNKLERIERIEKLYKWYKNKTNFFYTLVRMNKKSYYEPDEKYDEKTMKEIAKNKNKIKNEYDEDEEDKKLEKNNNEENKEKIDVIHEPIVLRKNKLSALLDSKSSNPAKFYYKKRERKSLKPEKENIEDKKSEKDEENKSTERKRKIATSININDRINELKNKFLAEKNSRSEMKNILEEFGKNRANFKSNLNKKFELKKIIKQYKIKNTFNKQLHTISNLSIKNQNNKAQNYNDNIKYNKSSYNFGDNSSNINNTNTNTNTITMTNNNKTEEIQEPKDNQINNNIKNESKIKDNIEEKEIERSQCAMHKKRLNKINLSKIKNISENNMLITANSKDYKDNYELHTYKTNENTKKVKSSFFLTGTDDYDDQKEEEVKEKIINVQVQFPKLKTSKTLMLDKINEHDSFMKNIMLDPLYRSKRKYTKLCSINNLRDKRCDTSDSNRSYSNINDNENRDDHDIDKGNNNNISSNSNDINEFTKKTLASESIDKNFLNAKKGFDILKKKEYLKLKNLMKSRDHYRFVNKSALFEAFTNPPKSNKYPILYLPLGTGSNLLLRPIIK